MRWLYLESVKAATFDAWSEVIRMQAKIGGIAACAVMRGGRDALVAWLSVTLSRALFRANLGNLRAAWEDRKHVPRLEAGFDSFKCSWVDGMRSRIDQRLFFRGWIAESKIMRSRAQASKRRKRVAFSGLAHAVRQDRRIRRGVVVGDKGLERRRLLRGVCGWLEGACRYRQISKGPQP
jgi:hypothetical protein